MDKSDIQAIKVQAKKPYGSVDERYLRDWLLGTLEALEEAQGKLEAVREATSKHFPGCAEAAFCTLPYEIDRILRGSKEGE